MWFTSIIWQLPAKWQYITIKQIENCHHHPCWFPPWLSCQHWWQQNQSDNTQIRLRGAKTCFWGAGSSHYWRTRALWPKSCCYCFLLQARFKEKEKEIQKTFDEKERLLQETQLTLSNKLGEAEQKVSALHSGESKFVYFSLTLFFYP